MSIPGRQSIIAQVVIGVTGHRHLEPQPGLIQGIRSAIESIKKMLPSLRSTPVTLSVLCPLAEGADRLVAREVLSIPDSTLEVVLPFDKEDYLQDFETSESRAEFEELLSRASSVRQLSSKGSRPEAYERMGYYIVDQCDVLIAVWGGKGAEGRGGTGDIVQYARKGNCPLFWVHTEEPGKITVEPGSGLDARPFHDLDEYNSERVNSKTFEQGLKEHSDTLAGHARRARLPYDELRPTLEHILCHFLPADLLALRFRYRYDRTGTLVYLLAAAAILLAAFQIVFLPERPQILIVEVVFMVAVLATYWLSRRQRWHSKWLDYRFLAERFRSALFIAASGLEVAALRPPRHLSLSYSSNDWMVPAFSSVWNRRPQPPVSHSPATEALRDFLGEAWIEDQIRYQDRASKDNSRRHERMAVTSNILFGLTLCAALLHVIGIVPHLFELILGFLIVGLPTAAASITAIRTHRDYLRNSMRSAEMVNHLKELKDQMMRVREREELLRLIAETEETMLHENEDWRVVVRFHVPELPV
jgi:hypothetical protein